ncbi:MAG: hypothetical protein CTY37_05450, partial [Methylotenera sp.]
NFLIALSKLLPKNEHHSKKNTNKIFNDERPFTDIDNEATALGNQYRGIGVTIGLLGVLIIFCEVAPDGFEFGHISKLIFTISKIFMMLLMAYLVWKTINSKLRSKWITARLNAEVLRYKHIQTSIENLQKNPEDPTASARVMQELNTVFDSQIEYNKSKASQYRAIEQLSEYLGWIGFAVALTGACLHLVIHQSWLIFPTAFVPACIGAIHGINGFLRISDMSEDHFTMAKQLESVHNELDNGHNPLKVIELAQTTYQILTKRDVQWVAVAEKLGLKVG